MNTFVLLEIELDTASADAPHLTEDRVAGSVIKRTARTTHPDQNGITSELGYREVLSRE